MPLKTRVIETEPEPDHKLLDKNGEDLEVYLTAETAFAEYECTACVIDFKDTYVLQTKLFRLAHPPHLVLIMCVCFV